MVVSLARTVAVQAQATTTRIVSVSPWNVILDPSNPQTPEFACLPEPIHLQGEIRSQVTKTIDSTGAVHYTHQLIPNQVLGVGLVSGARYRATGTHYHSGEVLHGGPPPDPGGPFHLAVMQNFFVIGQGRAPDFLLKLLARVTVNANGEAHAVVELFLVKCP
jgi:hypothetical protein